jgi:hypothetical protein
MKAHHHLLPQHVSEPWAEMDGEGAGTDATGEMEIAKPSGPPRSTGRKAVRRVISGGSRPATAGTFGSAGPMAGIPSQ